MTITTEQVNQRLAKLLQQRQELEDQLNATLGAIQDCHHWLVQLEAPEPRPVAAPQPPVAPEP